MIFKGIEKRLDLIRDELIKMNYMLDIIARPEIREGKASRTALQQAAHYLSLLKEQEGRR